MASKAEGEECYYDTISSIQQCMHERDKRRLELELELLAYSRSNRRISEIKCSKLRSYLKEICESEARAKMRNLELLRVVECIETDMKEYSSDHGPLQQQKADFVQKASYFKVRRKPQEELNTKAKVAQGHDKEVFHFHPTEGLTQTFGGADADAGATNVHSHQALHHSPDSSLHFHEYLPSGLLKDFGVSGERAPSNQAHLSVDISGSNDSPDGCNLSDKHERTMAKLPSVRAFTDAAANVPFGSDDEHESSPLATLPGPERDVSFDSSSPVKTENDFSEQTDSNRLLPTSEDKETELPPPAPGKEPWDTPENSLSPERNGDTPQTSISSLHDDGLNNATQRNPDSPAAALQRLSLEGLFYLLDNIEGQLHCAGARVYGDSSVDGRHLNRVIRLCNSGAEVKDEDLEVCGAVVLRELQTLSWSTAGGSILSEDVVNAHQSSNDPNEICASLTPDAAQLWDRWLKHALLLKKSRVLNDERLVELFTPLLLERDAPYSHKAKVLLRTLVCRSSEECPSPEDETGSSPPYGSPLLDGKDEKPTQLSRTKPLQELQSSEEDSQDESSVKSVPIRESKAYQLLKQSAMQTRPQMCEELDDDSDSLSGINDDHEDLRRAKCSSHQDPYPWKGNITSKALSALQSKVKVSGCIHITAGLGKSKIDWEKKLCMQHERCVERHR
eukprot:XP_011614180.1 PREDICTED: centrosomal protein kizuna isoform X2 [Takifugu rubripes]